MIIRAGPAGSTAWKLPRDDHKPATWQTPRKRRAGQAAPINVAVGRELTRGQPSPGPYHQVVASQTSISWSATLEPFLRELPTSGDWITYGYLGELPEHYSALKKSWQNRDNSSEVLAQLIPERIVRSSLIDHVCGDLAAGSAGAWDVSVDRFHGKVISAHFSGSDPVVSKGFALPMLIPAVADLEWSDIVSIRQDVGIQRLRDVLREVENEVLEVVRCGGDIEEAVHRAYERRLADASKVTEGIRGWAKSSVVELLIGAGTGYATTGLSVLGPLTGASLSFLTMQGLRVRRFRKTRAQKAWIGVMENIVETASP